MSAVTAAPDSSVLAPAVDKVQAIERECNGEIVESRDLIRILTLAVMSRTHVFVAGEGGVGKSFAAQTLMERLPGAYFRTQFSKDMTRDELFGPPDIGALQQGRYERDTTGMLPEQNLVLGDEFADSSTMIARSLLNVLNERILRDGRRTIRVPLWSFVATGNFWIEQHELAALFDRLAQRYVQPRVTSSEGRKQIMRASVARDANGGASPGQVTLLSAEELDALHTGVVTCTVPEDILTAIDSLMQRAEAENIFPSIRRVNEGIRLAQALAVLSGRTNVIEEDLQVFKYVLPGHPDEFGTCAEMSAEFAGKVALALEQLRGTYAEPKSRVEDIRSRVAAGAENDPEQMKEITASIGDINALLKTVRNEAVEARDRFAGEGRDVSELDALLANVNADQDELRRIIFG